MLISNNMKVLLCSINSALNGTFDKEEVLSQCENELLTAFISDMRFCEEWVNTPQCLNEFIKIIRHYKRLAEIELNSRSEE